MNAKLAVCKAQCVDFTEYDTQDGKKYYHNKKTNASVWDKPACLDELKGLFYFSSKLSYGIENIHLFSNCISNHLLG